MSSLGLPLGALVLLVAWAAAWAVPGRGGRPGPVLAAVAAAAPGLLVSLALLGALPRTGDVRVALEGLRFRLAPTGLSEVRIGGSLGEDHLYVRDLPPGFIRLRGLPDGVHIELAPEVSTAAERPVAVVRLGAAPTPFHNAVELHAGDRIVLPGNVPLTFDAEREALGPAAGGYPALPRRRSSVLGWPLPIGRDLPAEQVIYPLRMVAAPAGEAADLRGLGSFLCRGGWFRRTPYLVLADPGVSVETASGATVRYTPQVAMLRPGASLGLGLDRVDLREGELGHSSRVHERRSVRIAAGRGVVDVLFDTPAYLRLRVGALVELRRRARLAGTSPLLATVPAGFEAGAPGGAMLLELPAIGGPLGPELFSRIEVPDQGAEVRVTTHTGTRRYPLGALFAIGQDGAALLRITRLDLPLGLLALVWAAAVAGWWCGRERRSSWLAFVIVSGVEFLLALRLLIAYQGASLAPEVAGAVPLALGAVVAVPFVLEGGLALARRWRLGADAVLRELAPYALFATVALGVVLARLEVRPLGWLLLGLPVAAALVLGRVLLPLLARLPGDGEAPAERSWLMAGNGLAAPLLLGAAVIVVRLGTLVAFGWKERVDLLGQAVAVSLYYTPAVLLFFALLWRLRERWSALALAWLALVVLYLGLPLVAHDLGSALIFPLPVLLLLALPLASRRTAKHWFAAIPLLATLLVHIVLLPLLPALGIAPRLTGFAADAIVQNRTPGAEGSDLAADQDMLARRARADQNLLRLWTQVAPETLREVGTSNAEGLVLVMETLRSYASQGALGAGYLGVPLAESMRATQLDDNLSAVHILGGFGWVGALGLLALLAGWMVAPLLPPPGTVERQRGWEFSVRTAFGALLLWTLAVAGLYMVAANAGLLLFTGKNVYLLGAASRSDLVEGTLLAALALGAFAVPARPAAAPAGRPPEVSR